MDDIFPTMQKVTRVIAFIAHKHEHKYEIKQLLLAAKKLGYRDDLRIAKVTDPMIVKHYKNSMGEKWFDETSVNSIVVFSKDKKEDSSLNYYDLSTEMSELAYWINAASLEHVEKLSILSMPIINAMNMPTFIAYVDETHLEKGGRSAQLLRVLDKLVYKYPQYLFGYSDNGFMEDQKEDMGIKFNSLPALALFNHPHDD